MDRWPTRTSRVGVRESVHSSLKKGGSQNVAHPPHPVKTFCEIQFLSLLCWAPGPDFSSSPAGRHYLPEPVAA